MRLTFAVLSCALISFLGKGTKSVGLIKTLLVMKIAAVFCLVCLHVSATGVTQNVTLKVKDVPLTVAFKELQRQTGYVFVYGDTKVKRVTADIANVSLSEALDVLLKGLNLRYVYDGTFIIIKPINDKGFFEDEGSQLAEGKPPIDVRGKIVNEKGEPLAGVSVRVRGTDKGTSTNDKGEFSLKGIDENSTLQISAVNIKPFEWKVGGKQELLLTAQLRVEEEDEVTIVSTGYQQVSKERFVGSVVKVDSALLQRQPSMDLFSRLNGILPGALFTNSKGALAGSLGTTVTRRSAHLPQIRGVSTIDSDIDPLVILDNFPYTGGINSINPNDIESITVLRDAAAASIWGARAGNGVIVITTKSGKFNQPLAIQVSSNVTITEKPNLFYFPQMSSSDFIDVEQFLFAQGKYDGDFTDFNRPLISPVVEILKRQRDLVIDEPTAMAQIDALRSLDVRNDYDKYVFREGVSQQHYLSLSGGSQQAQYIISAGYDNVTGTYNNDSYTRRYTINTNTTFKPYKFLDLTAAISFSQNESKTNSLGYPLGVGGGKSNLYPYAQLADALGNHLAVPYRLSMAYVDTLSDKGLLDWHYRPLDELALPGPISREQFYNINIGANFKITSWLNASVQGQYMQTGTRTRNLSSVESYFARDLINTYYNPAGITEALRHPVAVGGILNVTNSEVINKNVRGQLNFNKRFGVKHAVTALVAGEIGDITAKTDGNRTYGYNDNVISYAANTDYNTLFPFYLGGTGRITPGISYIELTNRRLALLGNVSYTYNGRYSLYASARKDGANIFGTSTNNKWKPLWSTGIGWTISEESFYHWDWLSSLKLRMSYGYTGNNPRISTLTSITVNSFLSAYTGEPFANIGGVPNKDLRWEKVGQTNLGVDFSLKRNRISGSIDLFLKKSTDVIAEFPIDPTLGVSNSNTVTRNAGNLRTRGFDVSLNSRNIEGRFSWQTTFNISYAKTVVTKYYNNQVFGIPDVNDINPREGEIAYGIYSYRWAGLDPLTGDPMGYLNKQTSNNYLSIMNDSFQHHKFHGSGIPLYYGNILNSFSFKGFSLSFNIVFKFDYYFRKPAISYSQLINSWEGSVDYINRWQQPGDEAITTVPSFPSLIASNIGERDAFYYLSEVNVERGDHIRLQDVRVDFPSWNTKRLSLQFFLYPGSLNLLLWKRTNTRFDPEFTGGPGGAELPAPRSWTTGITLNLK